MVLEVSQSSPSEDRLLRIVHIQNEIATSDLDLTAVMELAVARARELTDAGVAILETLEGPHELRDRRIVTSDGGTEDPRACESVRREMDAGSTISVPLFHRGSAIGVLSVCHREPDHFSRGDAQALELISGLIAAHISHSALLAERIHDSRHDPLTDLPNRRAYEERLLHEVSRAQRHDHPLALCLLDLDGFKAVNDDLGHPTGDLILRLVADSIRTTRAVDEGFRIGGDEFAILLPETTAKESVEAVERILDELALMEVEALDRVGVTYGIASGEGDAEALHAAADRELLAAKAALYGRDPRPSFAA
jgi:diguanylate cyclase (GGDEF)-like protein